MQRPCVLWEHSNNYGPKKANVAREQGARWSLRRGEVGAIGRDQTDSINSDSFLLG